MSQLECLLLSWVIANYKKDAKTWFNGANMKGDDGIDYESFHQEMFFLVDNVYYKGVSLSHTLKSSSRLFAEDIKDP